MTIIFLLATGLGALAGYAYGRDDYTGWEDGYSQGRHDAEEQFKKLFPNH